MNLVRRHPRFRRRRAQTIVLVMVVVMKASVTAPRALEALTVPRASAPWATTQIGIRLSAPTTVLAATVCVLAMLATVTTIVTSALARSRPVVPFVSRVFVTISRGPGCNVGAVGVSLSDFITPFAQRHAHVSLYATRL